MEVYNEMSSQGSDISLLPNTESSPETPIFIKPGDANWPYRNAKTKVPGIQIALPPSPAYGFVTCRLSKSSIDSLIANLKSIGLQSVHYSETKPSGRRMIEITMKDKGVSPRTWSKKVNGVKDDEATPNSKPKRKPVKASTTPNRKGILKHNNQNASLTSPNSASMRRSGLRSKRVSLSLTTPEVYRYPQRADGDESDDNTIEADSEREEEVDIEYTSRDNNMSQSSHRPSLKLKLSTTNFKVAQPTPGAETQTPNPQSAVRTPSIKLNFGKKPSISAASTPVIPKSTQDGATPSSGKKRKRKGAQEEGSEDELSKPPPPQRRLTLKTSAAPTKTPVTPGPVFRLKTKGKIPKRPLGVGYDSELEDREIDPVLLEGFILRMQPGPDCDYIQAAIRDGTIGIVRAQGGADIRIRCLDTNGRRGIIIINGIQYATTVVDLPCIIEGMKSWDKKGWIKSIDICQMMLVLGRCNSDDEAKNYPLPNDVDPKTFAYAHGMTAPMKWVRKRRFARTRRARVDDIESIERKVNALLEADAKALVSNFQVFDHDPRIEQDQYSEVEDEYEDEDAEGEEDSYFPRQDTFLAETPVDMAMDVHVDQDQIDDIEAMFNEDDDDQAAPAVNGHAGPKATGITLHPPDARASSVAITSASASPSASAIVTDTPAEEGHQASSGDDEDDEEDASDRSDSEKDADDNLQQVKDRIVDMENKIREQTELLRRTPNAILKKKLAQKIGNLQDDVRMMKMQNGLAVEGEGEEGDD